MTTPRVEMKPYLPAPQLADAVMRLADRDGLGNVCKRAGIPERVLWRWRQSEGAGGVDLGDADKVMTRLELFWWEVWTEETVREPLFVVRTYRHQAKKDKSGVHRVRRIKLRTVPYGDLGTDFWRLREIRGLMCGQLEEVA